MEYTNIITWFKSIYIELEKNQIDFNIKTESILEHWRKVMHISK